jgi:hypothetical protein
MISDFAPLAKGNSWTYFDSVLSADGILDFGTRIRSITVEDISTRRDTIQYSLRISNTYPDSIGWYGNVWKSTVQADSCFETPDGIFHANSPGNPPYPCEPFVAHGIRYDDSLLRSFSKIDTLGRERLAYRFKNRIDFAIGPYAYKGNARESMDSIQVAKDVGAIGYDRSTIPFSLYPSITFRSRLIRADLH